MPKENKWAKDAQEKINGTKEPTSNVIKEKAQNSMNPMTILSHREKNKQQAQRGPASLGQITSQQEWQSGTAGNGSKTTEGVKE